MYEVNKTISLILQYLVKIFRRTPTWQWIWTCTSATLTTVYRPLQWQYRPLLTVGLTLRCVGLTHHRGQIWKQAGESRASCRWMIPTLWSHQVRRQNEETGCIKKRHIHEQFFYEYQIVIVLVITISYVNSLYTTYSKFSFIAAVILCV